MNPYKDRARRIKTDALTSTILRLSAGHVTEAFIVSLMIGTAEQWGRLAKMAGVIEPSLASRWMVIENLRLLDG